MEKTSKVVQVSGNGTYDGQYGRLYKWEIVLENGDSGQYMSKTENQNKFIIGQDATYTITGKDFNGRTYYTIKPAEAPKPQGSTGNRFQKDPETEMRITRMSVLKSAIDLVTHDKIALHQVLEHAKMFERYVYEGKDSYTELLHHKHEQTKQNLFNADKGGIERNFMEDAIKETEKDLPF